MAKAEPTHEQPPAVAGRRLHLLKVACTGVLCLFVLVIAALVIADVAYLAHKDVSVGRLWEILCSDEVASGIRLSLITSAVTLVLVMAFAVPIGYGLSRYRFRGHTLVNTIVDVPIVLPPVVIGLSLLALFGTPVGGAIKAALRGAGWSLISAVGIVMCQFLVSVSYCIRATKASFDAVDPRLEHVALTLGCSHWRAFRTVALPLARSGLLAGGVMAWARAIGVFGPLMVFVGTGPRVRVMPTAMWLELSVGNVETSLTIALVALALAAAALGFVHWLAPGRKWT